MGVITELCERLADVYELQGVPVRENLQPGISRAKVLAALAPLRLEVPEDVIELYGWRNGHVRHRDHDLNRNISFRDNAFLSIEHAVEAYDRIQESYGLESTLEDDRIDIKAIIPIAEFEGAWSVVACGAHLHGTNLDHPVINIFQGVALYYHSIEAMLRTNIDWVASPHWEHCSTMPQDVEMAIWRRHNPGIYP